MDPADALVSLLLTAGIPASQIPTGLEDRSLLWRDRLAGKRILLVLDDAAGHEQIRPLLPGTEDSMVLVTSRRHLTALEDTLSISLDTLAADEAAALLVRLAGRICWPHDRGSSGPNDRAALRLSAPRDRHAGASTSPPPRPGPPVTWQLNWRQLAIVCT